VLRFIISAAFVAATCHCLPGQDAKPEIPEKYLRIIADEESARISHGQEVERSKAELKRLEDVKASDEQLLERIKGAMVRITLREIYIPKKGTVQVPSTAQKNYYISRLTKQIAAHHNLIETTKDKASETFVYRLPQLGNVEVGKFGRCDPVKVIQVIDERTMLVRLTLLVPDGPKIQTVRVLGVSTADVVDDAEIRLPPVYVARIVRYTSVGGGSRTVFELEAIDLAELERWRRVGRAKER
jgi:hypothetical protein